MPTFNAIPSTVPFLTGDKFIELILGCVGSTKTSASLIKLIHEAKRVAPCADGIRRSRCAIIRNTREQLADTTIPDFLKWYPDGEAGAYMKTGMRYMLKVDDVECEVLFRGLDDSNDVRRLLSLQLSFAMMDEFREINADVFNALTGRLGRYPDKTMNGVGCCADDGKQIHKVWGASNPPDADTFWHTFIENPPENAHVVIQPSGRSPEADWLHCLPDGYYENLCHGKTEEWISIYVDGQFGKSLSGSPVFKCFNADTHVSKTPLIAQSSTLVIGVDAGLNPTAVITQQTHDGRVLVLNAVTGHAGGMGALRFCREILKPMLNNEYPTKSSVIIIDPAAFQRAQTDERCVADIFRAEGFTVKAARTNSIAARLGAVESYLTRTVNGNSAFLIDPKCHELIQGFRGKYRYKVNTKGERDTTPEKRHPTSDMQDACQYACLQHDGGGIFGGNALSQRREIKATPYQWAVG